MSARRRGVGVAVAGACAALVLALAGCGGTTTVTVTVPATTTAGLGPPQPLLQYGHIASLRRAGDHYLLRFDPAWFLSGTTANRAAAEDGAVEPGQPVPNDNYRVDESHRLYTYLVPVGARATVIGNRAGGLGPSPVSVPELARIVAGTSTRKLFEQLDTGVWITIRGDRVIAIDQQYVP